MLPNNGLHGLLLAIRNDLGANAPAAFQDSHDDELVLRGLSLTCNAPRFYILVHVPRFAADEGFISFDFATVSAYFLDECSGLHRLANPVQHEPSSLLSDTQIAGDFVAADSILAVHDDPH